MAVYALLKSAARKVLIGRFEPGEQRLDFRPFNITDKQAIASAERGFSSIYQIMKRAENLSISYEIEGGGEKIIGPSAGLAFALALYEELNGQGLSLAATGDISDSTKNARVLPVEFIAEKVAVGIAALSETGGGTIFYPQANDNTVTKDVRDIAKEKNVVLKPVKTLAEVVKAIAPDERAGNQSGNHENNRKCRVRQLNPTLLIFLLIFLLYLGGAFITQFPETFRMSREIRHLSSIIYPWTKTPLRIKVDPPSRDRKIYPVLCQRWLPALEAQKWHFDAEISCKSRLVDKTYTYWISFKKAELKTGRGQTFRVALRTIEGTGSSLDEAINDAVGKAWEELKRGGEYSKIMWLPKQDSAVMGE